MYEATDVSTACYRGSGTIAIMESAPFERRFRDAMTARQHLQAMSPMIEMVGRHLIGADSVVQSSKFSTARQSGGRIPSHVDD